MVVLLPFILLLIWMQVVWLAEQMLPTHLNGCLPLHGQLLVCLLVLNFVKSRRVVSHLSLFRQINRIQFIFWDGAVFDAYFKLIKLFYFLGLGGTWLEKVDAKHQTVKVSARSLVYWAQVLTFKAVLAIAFICLFHAEIIIC